MTDPLSIECILFHEIDKIKLLNHSLLHFRVKMVVNMPQ